MTTDPPDKSEVEPAPPAVPIEAAPEPTAVVDHTPGPIPALTHETPAVQDSPIAEEPDSEPQAIEKSAEVPAEVHAVDEPAAEPAQLHAVEEPVAEPEKPKAGDDEHAAEVDEPVKPQSEADEKPADEKPADRPRNPNLRWYVVKVQS